MKRKKESQPTTKPHHHKAELEIFKAVAQAWFSHRHHSSPVSSNEFDTHRRNFHGRPTRFRIEAIRKQRMNKVAERDRSDPVRHGLYWDFNQSLWDPYEIVAVSKRLERGLVLDEDEKRGGGSKVGKESKHSLRNLIDIFSSRRFNYPFLQSPGL